MWPTSNFSQIIRIKVVSSSLTEIPILNIYITSAIRNILPRQSLPTLSSTLGALQRFNIILQYHLLHFIIHLDISVGLSPSHSIGSSVKHPSDAHVMNMSCRCLDFHDPANAFDGPGNVINLSSGASALWKKKKKGISLSSRLKCQISSSLYVSIGIRAVA